MDIKVKGNQTLSGEIYPSGSKNSAVCLLPASILFDKTVELENIPEISDVVKIVSILEKLGSKIKWNKDKRVIEINNSKLRFEDLDHEDLGNMKGSSLLWGPMLARFGKVIFNDLPGGCTLGFRSLDAHYIAFKDLGVRVKEGISNVEMDASNAIASEIWLSEMSPTATENVIMLATRIKGLTRMIGAASEPQVQDLCNFLNKCGAVIRGVGSNVIEIEGGKELTPIKHRIFSDHYEVATFLALSAATGGHIKVHDVSLNTIRNVIENFKKFNIKVTFENGIAEIEKGQNIKVIDKTGRGYLIVKAQPWPSLPVDSLPLFIPLALVAEDKGQVMFHNWMYDAGLFWTSELHKLGANIIMADPHRVVVTAGNKLNGAKLEAPYIIRAVVAMVMAAMVSEGESFIQNADALYRGHPNFSKNLKNLGALIEEV